MEQGTCKIISANANSENCEDKKHEDSVSTASSHSEDENDELLFHKLSECCETAYADGINSADIYEALQSTSRTILENSRKINKSGVADNLEVSKFNANAKQVSVTNSKYPLTRILLKVMRNLRKTTVALLILILTALCLHFSVCSLFLNVSPFKTLAIFVPSFLHLKDKSCLLPSHPVIMEMVRPILNCSVCQNEEGGSPVIEFGSRPSKEEFLKVAYSSKPIIVRGGATVSQVPISFNFSDLKDIFESEPGGVDSVSEECQFLPLRSSFQTLREALETISNFSFREDAEQPWYIGWSNCHPEVAAKLRKLFPRPDFLPENSESSAIDWVFVGSPGLGAAMHIDYVQRPSWQAQLSGRKKWILQPPPDCEDICPHRITFTINPGDLLFLETNSWYHETFIESSEISISIGSEYD